MSSLRRFVQDQLQPAGPSAHFLGAARANWTQRRAIGLSREESANERRRAKGSQSCSALKFRARADDIDGMAPAATRSRDERSLVFTSSQAARYLGVSLATVRRWTDAGHVSCYRTPGGQRRFSRAQLDDFVASMQHDSSTRDSGSGEQPDSRVA
jgi:excisionase family DNA binding protein